MKKVLVMSGILFATLTANATGGLVSAGGGETFVLGCSSEQYQFSIVEDDSSHLYASLVKNPNSQPSPVGKYEVSALQSTGFTSAFASNQPEIYVTVQHPSGSRVESVQVRQFGRLKNINIDCE